MAILGSPWLGGPFWCCCEKTIQTCEDFTGQDWAECTFTFGDMEANDCITQAIVDVYNALSVSFTPGPFVGTPPAFSKTGYQEFDWEELACFGNTYYTNRLHYVITISCSDDVVTIGCIVSVSADIPPTNRILVANFWVQIPLPGDLPDSLPLIYPPGNHSGTPTCTIVW